MTFSQIHALTAPLATTTRYHNCHQQYRMPCKYTCRISDCRELNNRHPALALRPGDWLPDGTSLLTFPSAFAKVTSGKVLPRFTSLIVPRPLGSGWYRGDADTDRRCGFCSVAGFVDLSFRYLYCIQRIYHLARRTAPAGGIRRGDTSITGERIWDSTDCRKSPLMLSYSPIARFHKSCYVCITKPLKTLIIWQQKFSSTYQ